MDDGLTNGSGDDGDPALDRVRRDLADLGADEAAAPEVPAAVTARVGAALRDAGRAPGHSARPPRLRPIQLLGLIVAAAAIIAGGVLGAVMLTRDPAPDWPSGPTAESITVSRQAIPLPDEQLLALLTTAPDYGALADAGRRASCLAGLGYPAGTQVLGARPLDMHGRPAVLLLLPGDSPETVVAQVVEPGCTADHTGLLADTVIRRP